MGRGQVITFGEVDEWETLYASGLSSNDVGLRVGRSGRAVREHLGKRGSLRSRSDAGQLAVVNGKVRSRALRRDAFAALVPETAWVLGLIYGDGHVQVVPGKHYAVTLAGSEAVCAKAREILGSDVAVKQCSENGWRWSVYSKELVEDLASWGVDSGNKALTMRYPGNLSTDLEPHFLRGLWDSDGHWARIGNYVGAMFTTHSEGMAEDLQERLGGHLYRYICKTVKPGARGYRLNLRAEETRQFRSRVYADSASHMECSRKREIAFGVKGGQ